MRILPRGILLFFVLAATASLVSCGNTHVGQWGTPFPYDSERAAYDAKQQADYEAWEAYRERKIVRGLGGVIYYYRGY